MTTDARTALLNSLITAHHAAIESARKARFDNAKGNLAKLMALGVVVSCDDQMEGAMRWEVTKNLAAEAKIPFNTMATAQEYAQLADAVIGGLGEVALAGETHEERAARFQAAVAALPAVVPSGKKKACKHNETARERGWMRCGGTRVDFRVVLDYRCCRCGSILLFNDRPDESTEASRAVARQFDLLVNPQPTSNVVAIRS